MKTRDSSWVKLTPCPVSVGKYMAFYNATVSGSYSVRPSLIPSLCTHFTFAGIEWRR